MVGDGTELGRTWYGVDTGNQAVGKELFFCVMGVEGGDGVAKGIAGQMCIDFCSGDTFVAKHFLDGPEVGSILDKLGGKAVAERMRAHVFV